MKAVCWMGKHSVQVMDVPDPKILNERDAIIKITRTAICGSDLHLYNGYIPSMMRAIFSDTNLWAKSSKPGKR